MENPQIEDNSGDLTSHNNQESNSLTDDNEHNNNNNEVGEGEEEEGLNDGIVSAVSKYKDGTSRSIKKTRRKFAMNIATDEIFSNTPPSDSQPPLSPTSSSIQMNTLGAGATFSPNSILSKNCKSSNSSSATTSSSTSPFKPSPLSFSSGILPPNSRIDESPPTIGKYQLLHHLGQSYIGNTFSAVPPDSSEYVAIKLIDRDRINLIHQNVIANEFQLLKSLKHVGIVNYIGIINDNTGLGIVQEFYENGSLSDIYNRTGAFQESLIAKYTLQILEAMGYLHSQGIVHRNLKSNNVLLAKGGKVKISDFAVGIRSSSIEPSIRFSINGYPFWTSPEVLSMKPFNHKVDSWSIGCLILELVVGHPPFSNLDPMSALIEIINPNTNILSKCLDENELTLFSNELYQFLECCFKKEPSERASVHDLLKHPWLSLFKDSTHPQITSSVSMVNVNSSGGGSNRNEIGFSLDFLSQSEQNEKEISKLLSCQGDQLISSTSNQIDLKKFQFKHYKKQQQQEQQQADREEGEEIEDNFIELNKLTKDEQIEKLKSIIDHNTTIGNNLKYTMQEVLQEQTKYYDICESMRMKTLELLNQNKTGARISAHSNLLLKRTNQMANDLGRKNEILQSNIKRLEDYLITKDDCAKKLANVVYRNKTSFDSLLNPTLAANLLYQIGSKTWKKGQEKRAFATLKDNFLFFFKNEKSSYPIDVIYLNDKRNISITSIQDSKKKAYVICIGTTIHDQTCLVDPTAPTITTTPSTTTTTTTTNSNNSNNNINNNNNNNNESGVNLSTSPASLVNSSSNPSISNSITSNPSSTTVSLNPSNNSHQNNNSNSGNIASQPIPIPAKEGKEKKEKEKDKDKDKEKDKDRDKDLDNSNNSNNYNSSETIWCLLAFDNSKNMENWYGVLDSVVPWYDKRYIEISKPILPIENKKHQKQKSLDSSAKQGLPSNSNGDVSWKKESGGGIVKFQGVVGIRLDDLMQRESPTAELPYFLNKMLKFLEKNVDEEGILRLSGSSTEIQEMKAQLQRGESIDYTYKDPHAVTGLLKLFLRELPESILPEHIRIQATEILGNSRWDQKDKIREIQSLFTNLTRPHYNLLKHMLFFAKLVVDRSEFNKMVIANVTTCFSPTLRLPPGLFNFLINTYDLSFPKFSLST